MSSEAPINASTDIGVFYIGLTRPSKVDFQLAPPILELMVLPPIELSDLPIQQLDPPISKASVATRPKSPVEVVQAAYAILVLVIPNVNINAMDDAASAVGLGP
ncbi:UNVERIFIED_CONTAM: hypothetical protein K2H54_057038 [Gekko kuhli]